MSSIAAATTAQIPLRTQLLVDSDELKFSDIAQTLLASIQSFCAKELPSQIKVIDSKTWIDRVDLPKLGLDLSETSPIGLSSNSFTLRRFARSLDIEGKCGMTILTMPQGLTLNILGQIRPINIAPAILEEFGDIAVKKTYVIAITNFVLNETRTLSIAGKRKLVEDKGCRLPTILEICTLLTLTSTLPEIRSVTFLFNPLTYTSCSDTIGQCNIAVGILHHRLHVVETHATLNQSLGAVAVLNL